MSNNTSPPKENSFIGRWRLKDQTIANTTTASINFSESKINQSDRVRKIKTESRSKINGRNSNQGSAVSDLSRGLSKSMMVSRRKSAKSNALSLSSTSSLMSNRLRTGTSTSGPATAASSILGSYDDKILCSIYEIPNDLNGKIGISFFNLTNGEMIASEYTDSQLFVRTMHNINVYTPLEVYVPENFSKPIPVKLYQILKNNLSENIDIKSLPVKMFSVQAGITILEKHLITNNIDKLNQKANVLKEFENKPWALCSLAALYEYYLHSFDGNGDLKNKFTKIRIKYKQTEKTALIDSKTIKTLELIENTIEKNGMNLFKFLNHTVTKMGKRMMKNNLLQPLTDKKSIKLRLSCVQYLIDSIESEEYNMLSQIRKYLQQCCDLDFLFSKLLIGNNVDGNRVYLKPNEMINFVISLKTSLEYFLEISQVLQFVEKENSELLILTEIEKNLRNEDIHKILKVIKSCINEDAHWASSKIEFQNQRIYAIKSGCNGFLDVSRTLYQNLMDEIIQEVENLNENYNFTISYSFDDNKGFYLRILKKELKMYKNNDMMPSIFINRNNKNKNYFEFSTLKIMKLNTRLFEVMSEISIISEQMVVECINEISNYIASLFMFSESIAMLDFLCSLAFHAKKNKNYCMPSFINSDLIIKSGRHPILEKTIKNYIPNDTSLINGVSSFQILTGCNASGKSVYLKQTLILSIMAQIGSFVPCDSANFPIFQKFHGRLCSDTIEINSSTFEVELKEISSFLHDLKNKTELEEPPSTLLIIDEFGRGSSLGDGFAICLATIKYILKCKVYTILATHFNTIPDFLQATPTVKHISTSTFVNKANNDNKLHMTFRLNENPKENSIENYGLKLASSIFDKKIIKRSYEISKLIKNSSILFDKNKSIINNKELKKFKRIQLINETLGKIENYKKTCQSNNTDCDPEILKNFQTQFINCYSSI